jgi:tRNA(Leu) C34 or U34 (ribose-2'-O)-methylase TrmL
MPIWKSRGYAAIGLHCPVYDSNVGGALRAAFCYSAAMVAIGGGKFRHEHTDTTKAFKSIPLLRGPSILDFIPHDCVPVGVELVDGARNLVDYTHPERAFYIFGPENGSIGKEILSKCRDVVMVPTATCMNLASTVNVVLYDRLMKRSK